MLPDIEQEVQDHARWAWQLASMSRPPGWSLSQWVIHLLGRSIEEVHGRLGRVSEMTGKDIPEAPATFPADVMKKLVTLRKARFVEVAELQLSEMLLNYARPERNAAVLRAAGREADQVLARLMRYYRIEGRPFSVKLRAERNGIIRATVLER